MDAAMKAISRTSISGRSYAKRGLLYEAAYRYGQAVAMISMLYLLHGEEILALGPEEQQYLAGLNEQLAVLTLSLSRSAGNGRHKMGGVDSDSKEKAKESLVRVIGMLEKDIHDPDWLEER